MGGGSTLDLGIYTVFMALNVFKGERPIQVKAVGSLHPEHGTDTGVAVAMTFSGGRTATLSFHTKVETNCEAWVYGTKVSLIT